MCMPWGLILGGSRGRRAELWRYHSCCIARTPHLPSAWYEAPPAVPGPAREPRLRHLRRGADPADRPRGAGSHRAFPRALAAPPARLALPPAPPRPPRPPLPPATPPAERVVPERRVRVPETGQEVVIPAHTERRISDTQVSVPPLAGFPAGGG